MNFGCIALCLGVFTAVIPARADVFLGALGIEPDTPISGEEDIVIYNLTGPLFGCSTPDGTPICTPVSFDDVVLTINGSTLLDVGDVGPGETETYSLPGGVFVDGGITSLSLTADLSTTSLVDDLSNSYNVNSSFSLSGLPTDGTLANINGTPAITAATPEPRTLPVLALLFVIGLSLLRIGRVKNA